jgi:hypothetical protein
LKRRRVMRLLSIHLSAGDVLELQWLEVINAKEWWERLGDYTEIDPEWLKNNVDQVALHAVKAGEQSRTSLEERDDGEEADSAEV